MATEEKVLIDIQLKTGEALKRITEIGLETKKLSETNKQLTKDYADGKITIDQYTAAISKNEASIRLLNQEKKALNTTVNNEIKQATALEGSYDKLSAQYNLNKQKLNEMTIAERAGTEAGKALEKETLAIYQEMIKLQEATGKHVLSVGDYTKVVQPLIQGLKDENVILAQQNTELEKQRKSIQEILKPTEEQKNKINEINMSLQVNNQKMTDNKNTIQAYTHNIQDLTNKQKDLDNENIAFSQTLEGMKARLKELDKTMQTTDIGSKQFKAANEEAQKLRLKIDQTLGKVNEFGDKEPKNLTKKAFGDTAEAAAGLVSMIQLVNVLSGENENIAKVQAQAVKALAVSQLAVNSAKSIAAIMDVKELIIKGLLIAKEKLYAFAVDATTKKLKLAKLAFAGTGIGALVLLLGELIFNFDGVNKKINQAINYFDELGTKIAGKSKVAKAALSALLVVLLGPIAPIVLLIKLIDDFGGTIGRLQNFINGIVDEIANFADRFGILGDAVRLAQKNFNFIIETIKSLDGSTKKYKVDLADLQKQYDSFSEQIDRNNKKLQQQIEITKSQGKNEREVAALTRKLLQQTTQERQKALDRAIEISQKLIKQNGKLTDDQQKLFDKVQDDFNQAVTDQVVFENEIRLEANQKAKERAQERIEIERNLQHELIQLRNGFIKDEFEKQRADLAEQFRVDKENNDLEIKESIRKFGEKSQIVADLREKDKLLKEKYNDDLFKIDIAQADKEIDALEQKNETQRQIERESFVKKVEDLQTQANIEKDLLQASFVNTGKTNAQKKNQEIQHKNDLLAIELKFLQQKLELAKQFAAQDGIISDEEVEQINKLSTAIAGVQEQVKDNEGKKVIDGLGLTQKDMNTIQRAADSILSILDTIKSVIDANAANQIRAIDDTFKFEEAAIQHSTLSQEQKEEKIQKLNKKTAEKKYRIELEQFEANKALSLITAAIQTSLAVINALASVPFPANIAAAILAGAAGAVQIGIIASQPPPPKPQFYKGGYTGSGDPTESSTLLGNKPYGYHKEEYVIDHKTLQDPVVSNFVSSVVEPTRLGNTPMRLTGFADGGFTSRGIDDTVTGTLSSEKLANALGKTIAKLKVVTRISDINSVNSEVINNQVTARIG